MSDSITLKLDAQDKSINVEIPATITIGEPTPVTPSVPDKLIGFYWNNLEFIANKMVDYWIPRFIVEAGNKLGGGHIAHLQYDGLWMLMFALETFGDQRYFDGAKLLLERWVHPYVTRTATSGASQGYRNYSLGPVTMALSNGNSAFSHDTQSKARETARRFAMFSAYSKPSDIQRAEWPYTAELARELALGSISHMQFSRLNPSQPSRNYIASALAGLIDVHIPQWIRVLAANDPDQMSSGENNIAPFMFTHVSRALITNVDSPLGDFDILPRDQVVESLSQLADAAYPLLWRTHRHPNGLLRDSRGEGFLYRPDSDDGPRPDVSLFIFPWFAWLYKETGREVYKTIADKLFESGVMHAFIHSFKQGNQNMLWSRDGMRWMGWLNDDNAALGSGNTVPACGDSRRSRWRFPTEGGTP